jgi:cytochrome c biogenesis protein CcdA/thiol-disulfide isomerase/thioredoxin
LGLIISFSFFTLTLTSLIHAFGISPDFLRYAAILVMAFFGLTLLFPQLEQMLVRYFSGIAQIGNVIQGKSSLVGSGFLSGMILGVALGLIWTPCAGPILAAITTLAATRAVTLNTILITLMYSLGAALPMFLIAYGGSKIIYSTSMVSRYAETIRKFFGLLMILSALAIAFHVDVILQQFTLKYFPMITIEDNSLVKKELEKIVTGSNLLGGTLESQAPDFVGIAAWINTEPLSLTTLRGKVILVDFWTYSCINCVRTLPVLKQWYADYKDQGFVLVGVHTPEFAFEKNIKNVQDAVKRFGIEYPVALDSNYETWRAYNNSYWPAHYLIDQQGVIKERHFGEGGYQETENAIRALLGLGAKGMVETPVQLRKAQTPELYLGFARAQQYQTSPAIQQNQKIDYSYQMPLADDHIGLNGVWSVTPEFIKSESDMSRMDLNFIANRVYLVMQSDEPRAVHVMLDNEEVAHNYHSVDMNERGEIFVHEARMYDILDLRGDNGRHTLSLVMPSGVSAYAFTFGAGGQ